METEKRLKKDLKRTKALLADAQIMLDHMKNNAPSKRETAQLKNQVHHPTLHYMAHLIIIMSIPYVSDVLTALLLQIILSKSIALALLIKDTVLSFSFSPGPCNPLFLLLLYLPSQLEESEFTCAVAVKSRKGMEMEIEDLHIQMEEVVKVKMSVSERSFRCQALFERTPNHYTCLMPTVNCTQSME